MREILFKAKQKDWRELPEESWWVEGYYAMMGKEDLVRHYIVQNCALADLFADPEENMYFNDVEIDPETLCQYIGLKDKNGNRIWENDIFKGFTYPFFCDGEFNYFATVEWSEEYKYFFLYTVKNPESTVRGISEGNSELFEDFNSDDWEVIGNIFDDPELLKGE